MPQPIDVISVQMELYETNNYGEVKKFNATIDEIWYDNNGHPYQLLITWNGKSRRITPKYENEKIVFNGRYKTYQGFVSQ
jgi:hypothetical protein